MTAGPMKVGIDNYCYHRFFGEIYAQQKDPGRRITIEWFVDRAKQLGVDGVSLESCQQNIQKIECSMEYKHPGSLKPT